MYDNLLANVPTDLWIGGKWRKSSDGQRFDVIDPATENAITSVASASVEDAKAAVDAASDAFPGWAGKKPRERAEVLRKAFELIMRDAERFAKLITIENGKALSDSRGEVAYAAEFFRWFAEEAVRNIGQVYRAPASGANIYVHHKPAGVGVLVTPWNFPAAMATRKIGPALAAGCTVVLKPASETPLTMLALMPALEEAGVPAGVVNVIPSRRSGPVVSTMLHDPRVRVVSFTGSTEVGRKLLHEAADNVVRPAMELGGNAPFIVFEDADIDAAIEGAMIAKMRNMGEACTAANRFYVHEKVHDAFAEKFTAKMKSLKMGNGLDDGVALGPLVNQEGREKVVTLVADAVKKGAKVLTGRQGARRQGLLLSSDGAHQRAGRCRHAARGDFRTRGVDPDVQIRGRSGQTRERHRIRPRGVPLHQGHRPWHAGVRAARVRHDRPQPRPRVGSGGAVRRHEAERHRARRRARRADGIPRDAIHLAQLVSGTIDGAGEDRMRTLGAGRALLLAGALLAVSAIANAQTADGDGAKRLVGAWRYVGTWIDGRPRDRGPNPKGMIVYTASGHMAVQIAPDRERKKAGKEATPEEAKAALTDYIAYFGTYTVDERAGIVTHHRAASLQPGDVAEVVRTYEFAGERLILRPPNSKQEILWERIK